MMGPQMGLRQPTLGDFSAATRSFFATARPSSGTRISHRAYLARAERLAAGLAAQGVRPGDRVAVVTRAEFRGIIAQARATGDAGARLEAGQPVVGLKWS